MDKEVAVAFDVACIVSVEMDEVGIEGQRGVAEQEGARGDECV